MFPSHNSSGIYCTSRHCAWADRHNNACGYRMRRNALLYLRGRISISQSRASNQHRNMKPDGSRLYCSHLCMREEAQPILWASASWDKECAWRASTRRSTVRCQLGSILVGCFRCVNSVDGIKNFHRCSVSHVVTFLCTIVCTAWYVGYIESTLQIYIRFKTVCF